MVNPYQIHAQGIAAVQTEQGNACPQITWGGVNYLLLPGTAMRQKELAMGGFNLNADFVFTALVSTFLNATANGAVVTDAGSLKSAFLQSPFTYLGDIYKGVNVWLLAGGLQIHVEANSISQD